MKRILVLLTVVLACVSASVNAADVQLNFFTQLSGKPLAVSRDIHFTLTDLQGENIAEGKELVNEGVVSNLSLEAGEYLLTVEQLSTHFFGQINIVVEEEAQEPILLVLDEEGLKILTNTHLCPENGKCKLDKNKNCDCDDECVCKLMHKNKLSESSTVKSYGQEAVESTSDNNNNNTVVIPPTTTPNYAATNGVPMSSPYGANMGGRGLGALAIGGLVAAVIAVSVSKESPVSR